MNENIDVPVVPDDASTLADPADAAASSGGDCCHPDDPDSSHQHGYITAKDNYMRRLRRIEGQARGLQRMVEEEKYCIDILTQVSAMTKALQSVALELLEDHMAHCVVAAAREGGQAAEDKIQEASEAIARLVRS
ncbi:MAG TPA: metal-sensitive transcriptional regulator [Propioniciclava sp.]|jgi:DNA-binding FrmR family transcriptional regulator|uniref:metal-sensitive transcriptional regulator n=1 Tax=Propioniciclava sp. TaxID=2038686 RepID=UPI002C3698E3|nr:metal-sensitive transcriptional regulator [Propioniciclava sp.]HRL49480.1 metal-sensitive transcriptional regulator [Propioniciclava sp.]